MKNTDIKRKQMLFFIFTIISRKKLIKRILFNIRMFVAGIFFISLSLYGAGGLTAGLMENNTQPELQLLTSERDIIWYEDFDNLPDGVTMHAGQAGWDRDLQGANISGHFEVTGHKYEANDVNSEVLWVSEYINIKYYDNVGIRADLACSGVLESKDSVNVYYRVDGGPPIALENARHTGNFSPVTATASGISGEKLQLIAHFRNGASDEKHTLDNVYVTGEAMAMGDSVIWHETFSDLADHTTSDNGASPWTRDISNTSMGSTGYFDIHQHRLLGRNLGGEAVWSSGTIDISDQQGVDLYADIWGYGLLEDNEDYIKVYYRLDGGEEIPLGNGAIHGSASDLVAAGTKNISGNTLQVIARVLNTSENEHYVLDNILVVTKGDKDQDVIWYEDFDNLPDGVTMHAGQAGWDRDLQGANISGHFEVTGHKYEANDVNSEVLWVSEYINIKYYDNVGIRADLACSGVLESKDSVNVYYRVDGGPSIALDNARHTGNFSPVTATASGISGKKLQIIAHFRNGAKDEKHSIDNVFVTGDARPMGDSVLWGETFNELLDNATGDNGPTFWARDISNTSMSNVGYFEVRQYRLLGRDLGGEAVWSSGAIDISGQHGVDVYADIWGYGKLEGDQDYVRVYYKVDGGEEMMLSNGAINGKAGDLATAYKKGISGDTLQVITRMLNTSENERYVLDNVLVVKHGDIDFNISAIGGQLTCRNNSVFLDVAASVNGLSFDWSGPDGFTSTSQTPQVSLPGNYIVKATYGSITKIDTATVTENKTFPDLSTSKSGDITCEAKKVLLSASSSTSGVIFRWTGPQGFSSTQTNTTTNIPGDYEAKAICLVNGCEALDTLTILTNDSPPEVTASVDGLLSCNYPSISLLATSQNTQVDYRWYGPNNFVSEEQNPVVNTSGEYILFATDTISKCVNKTSVSVDENFSMPENLKATVSGKLTCANSVVTLTASSSSDDATYSWQHPDSNISVGVAIEVSSPGDYLLTASDQESGCSQTIHAIVEQDTLVPLNLSVSVSDTLSCNVLSTTLTASSSDANELDYYWTGPEGFVSNEQQVVSILSDTYYVTATNPKNGCFSESQAEVLKIPCDTQ